MIKTPEYLLNEFLHKEKSPFFIIHNEVIDPKGYKGMHFMTVATLHRKPHMCGIEVDFVLQVHTRYEYVAEYFDEISKRCGVLFEVVLTT